MALSRVSTVALLPRMPRAPAFGGLEGPAVISLGARQDHPGPGAVLPKLAAHRESALGLRIHEEDARNARAHSSRTGGALPSPRTRSEG